MPQRRATCLTQQLSNRPLRYHMEICSHHRTSFHTREPWTHRNDKECTHLCMTGCPFFVTILDRETVQSSVVIGVGENRRIREGLKARKNIPRLITSTTLFNTDSNVMVTHAPLTVTFVSKVITFAGYHFKIVCWLVQSTQM